MARYELMEQKHQLQLTRSSPGFYGEVLIENHTRTTIGILNHLNVYETLPPSGCYRPIPVISIIFRSGLGPTLDRTCTHQPLPGGIITIMESELQQGPVYVEEVNLVIAYAEQVPGLTHPYCGMSYEAILDDGLRQITDSLQDNPSVTLIANDPENRCDVLYTAIGEYIQPVNVSHIRAPYATLTLCILNNGSANKLVIDLEKMFEASDEVLEPETGILSFITIHKSLCTQLLNRKRPLTQQAIEQSIMAYDEELKRVKEEHRLQLDTIKLTYDNKLRTLSFERDSWKTQHDDVTAKYTDLKATVAARQDVLKDNFQFQDMQYKSTELGYKAHKAELEHDEAKLKLVTTAIAVVAGGVGFKLISLIWDKLTENKAT